MLDKSCQLLGLGSICLFRPSDLNLQTALIKAVQLAASDNGLMPLPRRHRLLLGLHDSRRRQPVDLYRRRRLLIGLHRRRRRLLLGLRGGRGGRLRRLVL